MINQTIYQWGLSKLKQPLKTKYSEDYKLIPRMKKPRITLTSLQTKLKRHHKNKDGTQIVNLPKLPFGQHETYNSEEEFSKSHFVTSDDDLTPRRRKELTVLSHKFKLMEKRNKRRYKSLSQGIFSAGSGHVILPTHSGQIVTVHEDAAVKAYDAQLNTYLGNTRFVQTNREVQYDEAFEKELNRRVKAMHVSVDLETSTTRLHESTRRVMTTKRISRNLEQKFSVLNAKTAEGKRWVSKVRKEVG